MNGCTPSSRWSPAVAPPSVAAVDHADRDVRQRQVVPPERLVRCRALVIGVGAVGRQVALQLAAVGVGRLELVDDDHVGVENLAPQAYWHCDVGVAKVEATAEACRLLNPAVQLSVRCERFRRSSPKDLSAFGGDAADADADAAAGAASVVAVFCCVDSIAMRKLVWESVRSRAGFFADGRMAAEVVRVLASAEPATDAHYASTLFAPQEAYAGACTARATVYAASVAAGLMLSAFTRWLRGIAPERDVTLNLLAGEMSVR